MAQTTTQDSTDSTTPPSNASEGTRTVAIVVGVVACVALLVIIMACYCIIKKRKASPPPIDNTTTTYRKDSLFIEYDSTNDVICKKQGPVANRADNSGFYSKELPKQARLPTKQNLSGHMYAGENTEMTMEARASPFSKKVDMTQKELEEEATFTY